MATMFSSSKLGGDYAHLRPHSPGMWRPCWDGVVNLSRWVAPAALLLALIATGLATVALLRSSTGRPQGPQGPQTKTIEVSYDDLQNQNVITREATLATGDTLKVTLASNGSTGFSWNAEAQISDSTVMQQTGHESVEATGDRLGAWGTEVWTFKALKAGATTIMTDYGRPWDGGEKKVWTFTANVTVR